jgi:hypothetical protein
MTTGSPTDGARPSQTLSGPAATRKPGHSPTQSKDLKRTLLLALGALGVVYGDIGTSPLYTVKECFHGPHAIALTPPNLLGVVVNAWRIHPAKALLGNDCGLGDDQPGRGALGVVFGHQIVGQTLASSAGARERRHDHAVAQGQSAQVEG